MPPAESMSCTSTGTLTADGAFFLRVTSENRSTVLQKVKFGFLMHQVRDAELRLQTPAGQTQLKTFSHSSADVQSCMEARERSFYCV